MEYTPYFDTLRKTRLLRGMTDAELTPADGKPGPAGAPVR